ncbi:glycoside hydrolase family 38 C-terminal domain-containing protein [Microbacterium betulae]|uniref:Glycoside hydrolase family 38 C-terminal domain-containing protein n=1 Tax=Microbacterium betulae TaxID=2981139 RepID=A0AA97I5V2_9MICO|nr:glycoside hydrolase family 38 C-terminal domain-containing protein [Microbacterium sp. AB]WOF23129.1 glycoside hydrolase family 38 C-terminal domain-containing protein [Microbacterium sp. AB]
MHDDSALVEARIARTHRDRIAPAIRSPRAPVAVEAWEAPGEPVPFAEAAGRAFSPLERGEPWGRPWGTTWLRVRGSLPGGWRERVEAGTHEAELVVDLGFTPGQPGFQSEGLVYTPQGSVLKGLEPLNDWIALPAGEDGFEVYIEAASNPDVGSDWSFRPTPVGDRATAGDDPLYRFGGVEVVLRDRAVFALDRDWTTLAGLLAVLPERSPRRAGVLRALERASDALDPDDVAGSAADARAALAPALASSATGSAHRVAAVGHAHIDSAWLWPVRETVRKCARTFSNVLDLMDRYPDFVFAASSAQQYLWMQESYPEIFDRIRARVAEGRWVPVGGMWVESDTNMPGGEALARQFVAGKGYFLRELGVETTEVWLPDSFGYSAALPQIVAASASDSFLTQKISWNETNVMPHHTFLWEGIDGSRVFTHFPPVDRYNSDLGAVDLDRAERQHAERGISDLSLVPFGFGDGGGGPTREMIETAHRKRDLEGSPRVELTRPDDFFAQAKAELPAPSTWSGELYLEFHRGTYTSQARTKAGNRRSEHLLREAELWAATAAVRHGAAYPADRLRDLWRTVLLQQFHDILPGSSIAWVHQQAEEEYARVAAELEEIVDASLDVLAGGTPPPDDGTSGREDVVFNAAPVTVDGVAAMAAGHPGARPRAGVSRTDDGFVLEGEGIRVVVDARGEIVSLIDTATGREAIAPEGRGNVLQLFRDTPNQWDAWDLDHHFNRTPQGASRVSSARIEGDAVVVEHEIGRSAVTQRLRIAPHGLAVDIETTVDWHERQKLLKLSFDVDVLADTAASEIQFGHVRRPVHANTSWDAARFETVAHRWLHVDEPGFGVTLANDRVYGHDVTRRERAGGGGTTRVRESLLRAPVFPDPSADQGVHVFRHALSTGGILDAVAEGYRLNLPTRSRRGGPVEPLVRVEGAPSVLVEAVKLAEDGSGDVVVRLYEARGGRARGRLVPGFAAAGAVRTDLLERPLDHRPDDALALDLRPFELVTVRIGRA